MKHLFIVNPAAGGRDQTGLIRGIVDPIMARLGGEYEFYVTKAPMDARNKIKSENYAGDLRVYACGGDGTLNECVNGAFGLDNVAVTNFPCGTGNDFIKAFGDESGAFLDMEALITGYTRKIDLIDCNGRISVNICSSGFDARVGADVHKYSSLPLVGGKGGYIISVIANFIKGICGRLRARSGDYSFDGEAALVCACNGNWYGGSFNPVPEACLNDGYLDFLIVSKLSRLKFLSVIGKYATGRYRELGNLITHIRGKRLDLEADGPVIVNIDGEIISAEKISFEIIPRGLNFIFPSGMAASALQNEDLGDIGSNQEISAN